MLAGRFDAAIFVAQLQNLAGDRGLIAMLGEDSYLGYDNPQVAPLLAAAQEAVDQQVLDSLYRDLTEIFRTDLPVTVLIPSAWSTVARSNVRGLVSPHAVDPVAHAHERGGGSRNVSAKTDHIHL